MDRRSSSVGGSASQLGSEVRRRPSRQHLIRIAHSAPHLFAERGPVATEHEFPEAHVHYKWDVRQRTGLVGPERRHRDPRVARCQRQPADAEVDANDIETLDWDRVYPLAGPIAVDDAPPGDTLAVEILELRAKDWGWTAIIPGLGLLPDDFSVAYLRVFDLTDGETRSLREDVAIPIEPFFGTMGVCPSGAKDQAVMPPGTFGGNMDTRQLVQGSTLYLPVRSRARSSPAATPTRPRATARSA